MRLVLAALLLTVSVVSIADDRPVATPAATIPAVLQPRFVAASDGTDFLVLWSDKRTGAYNEHPRMWSALIRANGARSTPQVVQDRYEGAQPEYSNEYYNDQPGLTWTGGVYLAVWYDFGAKKIHSMRFDRDGRMLDAQPREIAVRGSITGMASNGNRTLVLVSQFTPGVETMKLLLFDTMGTPVREPMDLPWKTYPYVLASNGKGFLILYAASYAGTTYSNYIGPISEDGVIGTGKPIEAIRPYDITSNGTDYLLAYRDSLNLMTYYRYDATGAIVGGRHGADTATKNAAAVPYQGGWLVALEGTSGTHGRHLDNDGVNLEEIAIAQSSDTGTRLYTNGSAVLDIHQRTDMGGVYHHIVGLTQDALLQSGPAAQSGLAMARMGNDTLALWSEKRESRELRATRIDANGAPRDGEGLVIAHPNSMDSATALGSDGANFIAAWNNLGAGPGAGCDIRIARITPGGALPDGPGGHLVDYDCAGSLALGSGSDRVLLVWGLRTSNELRSMVLDRNGISISTPLPLPNSDNASNITATWNGHGWLLTWAFAIPVTIHNSFSHFAYDTRALRIAADGSLIDAKPLPIATSPSTSESGPATASDGEGFVVAWQEADAIVPNPTSSAIFARRVNADGTLGPVVSFGSGSQPAVAWNGSDFVVGFTSTGGVYTAALSAPAKRQLLVRSDDTITDVVLAGRPGSILALYLRSASEWPYLVTPTAFVTSTAPPHRRAATR